MPTDFQEVAAECQTCQAEVMRCKHNYFSDEEKEIHTWEHRCKDCGFRETGGFRSDEPEDWPTDDPTHCPFCGRPAG